MRLGQKIFLLAIRFYQATLSPDHGLLRYFRSVSACRFRPTCSEYAYQAIEKYGLIKGGLKGFRRFLKCNPFNLGGFDPVK